MYKNNEMFLFSTVLRTIINMYIGILFLSLASRLYHKIKVMAQTLTELKMLCWLAHALSLPYTSVTTSV